ncbi:MAG: sulfotransferase domain-containing protein [Bacteroidia bacterium]
MKNLAKKSLRALLPGNAPDFLIIGAQKSGTSSLHYYLTAHPEMVSGILKEINFFSEDANFNKGVKWYENHFKHPSGSKKIFFEASPAYFYNKKVVERIYKYKSDIKLIALLRNPVDRAYSSWNMYRNFYDNNSIPEIISKSIPGTNGNLLYKFLYKNRSRFPSFKECIDYELNLMKTKPSDAEPSFLRRGTYYEQIARYLKYFSRDQLLIFGFKEFVNKKTDTLYKIENFLGVSHYNFNNYPEIINKVVVKNQKIRYAEKINESEQSELTDYFNSWNQKLFELLGRELQW